MTLDDVRESLALNFNRRLMMQPLGARCTRCGITNPLVLVQHRRPVLCYTCRAKKRGLRGIERHHLGGRPSPVPSIAIDANLHRVLTYLQVAWRRAGYRPGTAAAVSWDREMLSLLSPLWTQHASEASNN